MGFALLALLAGAVGVRFCFERSGHLPNAEERDAFNGALVDKVLPLARSTARPG